MADKNKSSKTKIKVEELTDEDEVKVEQVPSDTSPIPENNVDKKAAADDEEKSAVEKEVDLSELPPEPPKVTPEEKEEPKDDLEKTSILEPPKVASFSQLDTSVPEAEKPKEESLEKMAADEAEKAETLESSEKPSDESPEQTKEGDVSSDEIKEWLKEVRPDTTKEVEKSGGPNFKIIVVFVLLFLVLGAVVGGVLYYKDSLSKPKESMETPSETTETPAPTEQPEEVDLTAYSFSVLNGSGTAGEAGKVEDLLVREGFAEDKVTTGNADSYDYKATSVSLKENLPDSVYNAINSALGDTYEVVKSDNKLDADSSYDVIIIVGDRKAQ